jgi:predicted RNA-binding Zn ribbon-like protein
MQTHTDPTPAWFPGTEKPAPMPLMLVQAFLNTLDLEEGTDLLADGDGARAWLVASGALNRGTRVTPADLAHAREVREAIRRLLAPYGDTSSLGPLRELAKGHRARLQIDERGAFSLASESQKDLGDALFGLLLVIRAAQEDGTWTRLKACANPECAWVFYDRSRNHQGSWCNMAVCGNRLKNRSLRARRR